MAKLPGLEMDEAGRGPKVDDGGLPPEAAAMRTARPVFLKKTWGRNVPGIEVGSCIGIVMLPEGVDLNLLVDSIRHELAGEEKPVE